MSRGGWDGRRRHSSQCRRDSSSAGCVRLPLLGDPDYGPLMAGGPEGSRYVSARLDLAPPAAPRERADAARNRRKVLAAAAALFGERGVANVSMDEVAAAAGV